MCIRDRHTTMRHQTTVLRKTIRTRCSADFVFYAVHTVWMIVRVELSVFWKDESEKLENYYTYNVYRIPLPYTCTQCRRASNNARHRLQQHHVPHTRTVDDTMLHWPRCHITTSHKAHKAHNPRSSFVPLLQ